MGIHGECWDVHTHVLPGVDDGPRDTEDSVALVAEAAGAGVRRIICTPHVSASSPPHFFDEVSSRFESFRELVRGRVKDVDLYLGAEIMLCPELPEMISRDKRLTFNGAGSHALIEMPVFEIPIYAHSVFFDLLAHGITPIWAHPERCRDVIKNKKMVLPYVQNGVLLQLNAGSLTGVYGWLVRWTAASLLRRGLVHLCASDAHRPGNVKDRLPKAVEKVSSVVEPRKALEIFVDIPSRTIQ